MNLPAWMRDTEDYADVPPQDSIPTIATIPEPKLDTSSPPEPEPVSDEAEVLARAALTVNQFQRERERMKVLCGEATFQVESLKRQIEDLTLENLKLKNDLAAQTDHCERLRQETSDLRAFFSSIRAQFDHFEIPLPIRKRAQVKHKAQNGEHP